MKGLQMGFGGLFALAAILGLASASTEAFAQARVPVITERPMPAALKGAQAALDAFHQALRNGDRRAALVLLAEDALIYESGHAEGKSQYAAHHLEADMAFAKQVPATAIKRSGAIAGPLAWITTEGRTTGIFKGKAVDRRTVETALIREEAGSWKILHLHWSSAASK